jgi:putative membrane protein
VINVSSGFFNSATAQAIIPIISVLAIFSAAFLHGNARYGFKNIVIFFIITWFISNFFEALSIQTGFPFGYYYYDKLVGPRIFDVPLIIMFAYFGTGYASWILAHILLGQYSKKLIGKSIFYIPLIATFIMVMWDVCMDPICSTIGSLWVWKNGGSYFGVPIQNYFGWFFVVFIAFQLFAIYISKFDSVHTNKIKLFTSKIFWMEAIALYGIQGLTQLINPINQTDHLNIYNSMAMITVFTMMFVTLLSFINLKNFTPVSDRVQIP